MSDVQHVDLHTARKRFSSLQASFALRGYAVDRLTAERGFRVTRGASSVDFPDLRTLCAFASEVGIILPREASP